MTGQEIVLPYRGSRNYVHGTTLFSWMVGALAPAVLSDIDFRVNRRMDSNRLRLIPGPDAASLPRFPCALSCTADGVLTTLAVDEVGDVHPQPRDPYDEAALVAAARFGPGVVALQLSPGDTFIDALVALNKELLLRLHPLPAASQYVFARLELRRLPGCASSLRLRFWRSLGSAHFITRVEVDGAEAGTLHFSRWSA